MIRFSSTPDECFQGIVTEAIEFFTDEFKNWDDEPDEIMDSHIEQVREIFDAPTLLMTLEKLLEAHQAPGLYMPTDYHFLVLYDVLELTIELHNDLVEEEDSPQEIGGKLLGTIDFDWIADYYFWDLDFLSSPQDMNNLSSDAKATMGFSKETFGVVNRMAPHPDELEMKLVNEKAECGATEFYLRGEDYPYYPPEEEVE